MARSNPTTWGVGCWQTHRLEKLVAFVEAAERSGFDELWYGNEKLHADMWSGLAVASLHSQRLRLGTFIVDPYSLHPAVAAAAVATIDAYSGGRALLVFGAGGSGLRELGLERRRPVATLESAVLAVRALLSGDEVSLDCDAFSLDSQLHFPTRADLPVWLAARAPGVLELAGRIADGAMIGTTARPQDIRAAIDSVRLGAEAAGRTLDDLTLSVRVDVSVAEGSRAARDVLRGFVAGILSASYPDRSFVQRAGVEVPQELEQVCRTKDLALAWRSGALVTDELVDAFAWAGTADEVAADIAAAIDSGVGDITVMFHPQGGDPARQLVAFAADVMPRVSALLGRGVESSGGSR